MELPKRKLSRLPGYDYASQNYYFVTICTHQKRCLFGLPDHPSEYGRIAKRDLMSISQHFDGVRVDQYVVMPNHIHAVIVIGCDADAERSRPFPTLSTVVGLYKSGVSKQIHEHDPNLNIWQKSFYDTVIRNESMLFEIRKYIEENPAKWREDELYAEHIISEM